MNSQFQKTKNRKLKKKENARFPSHARINKKKKTQ
jgi:hypothetical protein